MQVVLIGTFRKKYQKMHQSDLYLEIGSQEEKFDEYRIHLN